MTVDELDADIARLITRQRRLQRVLDSRGTRFGWHRTGRGPAPDRGRRRPDRGRQPLYQPTRHRLNEDAEMLERLLCDTLARLDTHTCTISSERIDRWLTEHPPLIPRRAA